MSSVRKFSIKHFMFVVFRALYVCSPLTSGSYRQKFTIRTIQFIGIKRQCFNLRFAGSQITLSSGPLPPPVRIRGGLGFYRGYERVAAHLRIKLIRVIGRRSICGDTKQLMWRWKNGRQSQFLSDKSDIRCQIFW